MSHLGALGHRGQGEGKGGGEGTSVSLLSFGAELPHVAPASWLAQAPGDSHRGNGFPSAACFLPDPHNTGQRTRLWAPSAGGWLRAGFQD